MAEVVVRRRIGAPAEQVWDLLSDFGGLRRYNERIASCTVEGDGVGAVRTIGMGGGLVIRERLEAHDPQARHYAYSLVGDTPLPFENYRSDVRVEPAGADASVVDWRGRFDAADEPAAVKIVTGVYTGGLAALGKHLGVAVEEPG